MTEIKIEKKKPVWPWIVGLLIIAAIVWIVVASNDDEVDTMENINTEEVESGNTSDYNTDNAEGTNPAMAFVDFVNNNAERITLEHEYSHQALTHLSNALQSVSRQASENTQIQVSDLKQKADALTKNTYSLEHADKMAEAFSSAASAMESMQQEMFPNLQGQVNEVKDAANQIDPAIPATDQKEAIRNFYEKSADAVEAMANKV